MSSAGVRLQHALPQRLMARIVYRAARSERPWLKRRLIRWFAAHYGVDLSEAEHGDLDAYASFNAFFTRALKPGARRLEGDDSVVVSPVDGRLTEHGTLDEGRLLQAKGVSYALAELVGDGPVGAERFARGSYATIYLAPRDYHRVHMPLAGRLTAVRYIPGRRFSVNEATAAGIRNLFCRNERVVCWFETEEGWMALVLVGALNVSSISLVDRGEIASGEARYSREPEPRFYAKGAEIARFNLGSTVIVLFPAGEVEWDARLRSGEKLRLGEAIGKRVRAPRRAAGEIA